MIAVTLADASHIRQANASAADVIEIRTDLYPKVKFLSLLAKCRKPVIFTIKTPQTVLLDYIDHPIIRYVDIDYRLTQQIQDFLDVRPAQVKLIVSFHDFQKTPSWQQMQQRVKQLRRWQPDIIKVATMIRHFDDLAVIMRLQQRYSKSIIAVGMGDLGIMTRIYNRAFCTYARLAHGKATAPGQLTVAQLRQTKIFGLVGEDIQHSLSPIIHRSGFQRQHLPHMYQLWETDNLALFMQVFRWFGLPGASVTKPFKKPIVRYLDALDLPARRIRAVNTLVRRGQKVIGYNTDWIGAQQALRRYWRGKKVLILGAGGVAAAVAYAAKKAHAKSVTILRREDVPTDDDDFDILVNATPVYDMVLVPEDALYSRIVMDCNYATKTELLKHAEHRARVVLDGLPMLRYQAAEQFKLWTGKRLALETKIDYTNI